MSAPISHGSSGGPIVNTHGEVIGVASAFLSAGQNLNFAVPSPLVTALLIRSDVRGEGYVGLKSKLEGGWITPRSLGQVLSTQHPEPKGAIGGKRPGESSERASLRNLKGVQVVVERLSSETEKVISADQIQQFVEHRLRRSSVRVLSKDEMRTTPGMPELRVHLEVFSRLLSSAGTPIGYLYSFTIDLEQGALLERDPSFFTFASTWQARGTAVGGAAIAASHHDLSSLILQHISEEVDRFINDYLASQ